MVARLEPNIMIARIDEYRRALNLTGMSSACAAGLRPARKAARKRGFGFTDRTGITRKRIGPVRRYKASTARQYGTGGAYFRGGGIIGASLEYLPKYARYRYLEPALRQAQGAMREAFIRQADKEIDRAVAKAIKIR